MYPEMPRAISRSTMDVETDDKSQTIVRGILALAHGLGMRVTAEGVETADQANWLRNQGCDRLQGNLFSAPIPAGSMEKFLRQHPWRANKPTHRGMLVSRPLMGNLAFSMPALANKIVHVRGCQLTRTRTRRGTAITSGHTIGL